MKPPDTPFGTDPLGQDLRALRPVPAPAFAAEMERRVAAGFPRKLRLSWRPPEMRRMLAPAAAAATLVVVTGVALVEADLGGSPSQPAPEPVPMTATATGGKAAPGSAGADRAAEAQTLNSGRGATAELAPAPPIPAPGGGIAPGQPNRVVESSAQLTLATESDQVQDVADGVVQVTHGVGGIVLSANTTHSDETAQASFDLAIPSARLPVALDRLSELAHVQSSSEGSLDITAPFSKAKRRLEDAQARLASLRTQLDSAEAIGDTAEIARLKREIHATNFRIDQAQRQVDQLSKRARFARVSVTVVTDTTPGDGSWGLDDAFDDARDVLRFAAGVAVVSAAVLLPLALLSALVAVAWRAWVRRSREAALGADTE